ncbi:hypothetical protein HMN09_01267800 [Mycena chlorophos]|uniref:Uncharacterized protein n=1 Tax=Mycena chlorophos TaxID=658473 RepID=A0A8H6VRB1_MYCCL|nr:hypothetical protein HMN09_01267800 [Mycena chlorophos]
MDYESQDILGSSTPLVRAPPSASTLPRWVYVVFILAGLFVAYVTAVSAWEALLKWREKSYRLTMRRRHGIPDSDHRPFNVAHAAVLRARREQEVAANKVHRVDVDKFHEEADRRQQAAALESDMRQRKNIFSDTQPTWSTASSVMVPGRFNPLAVENNRVASTSHTPVASPYATNFAERYNPNPPAPAPSIVRFAEQTHQQPPSRRSSLFNLNNTGSPRKQQQKRTLDEHDASTDVPENPKKTRVEGDEFIDGDEDAEWLPRQAGKRGEKRVLRDEDAGDDENDTDSPRGRRPRGGKRARKQSLVTEDVLMTSDEEQEGSDMDVDAAPVEAAAVRGQKRDAVASFGQEDEVEQEVDTQKAKRKRKSRKSDVLVQPASRGQKRDRDLEEEGSDGEGAPGTPARSERKTKKRGKKSRDADEDTSSVDSSAVKRRAIGEQWESNGVVYKIGPNGQRLRQALVKKAARRFVMPLDSQHPDKNANLEVCIETWLTEEEYQDFKSRHLLAWQDSPKGTQEPETVPSTPAAEVPATPTPAPPRGKDLLWDSPASPFAANILSPAEKEPGRFKAHFKQTVASDLGGIRANPFENVKPGEVAKNIARLASRRIGAEREQSGLADSTNNGILGRPKTFSKWEKQNLEAQAMSKIREATQAKQREKELRERLEREKAAAAAAPAPTTTIPTLTLTAPTTESAKPAGGFSLLPSTTTPTTTPASTEAPKSLFPTPAPPAENKPPSLVSASPSNPLFAKPAATTPAAPAAPLTFSFGPSSTTAKAAEPAQKPASFPFAQPSSVAAPAAQPPQQPAAAGGGGSLFARLGDQPAAPTPAASTPNAFFNPAAPAPAKPSGEGQPAQTSLFSFGPKIAAAEPVKPAFPTSQSQPAVPTASATPGAFSLPPPAAGGQQQSKSAFAVPQVAKPAEGAAGGAPAMFSFAPKPAAAGAEAPKPAFPVPAAAAADATAVKPNAFSFAPSSNKSVFGPQSGAATTATQPAAPQAQSGMFSFAKPADPTKAPSPNPFGAPAAAPAGGAPKFSFGNKPAAAAAPSSSLSGALGSTDQSAAAAAPGKTTFSFGTPTGKPEETKPASTTPAGAPASGMFSFGGEQKKSAFGTGTTGSGAFGFGAPAGTTTTSVFGNTNATAASTNPAAAAAAPKPVTTFSFGGAAKPAETAPAASSLTTTTTPAAAVFNFGAPKPASDSTTPAGSPAPSNPFGAASKPSAFGATTTSAAPNAFASGTGAAPSAFGNAPPSAFGAPKPAETSATTAPSPAAFSFGSGTAGTNNTTASSIFGNANANGSASKSLFGPTATSTTAAPPPIFGNAGTSAFGAPAKPTEGGASAASTSLFGGAAAAAAGPSAFGFGAPAAQTQTK